MKLDDYIRERRAKNRAFDEGYDQGRDRFRLAQAICLARQDAGMSQVEVARQAKVRTWHVAKVERRIEFAEPELIEAVAAVLAPWLKRYGWEWARRPPASASAGRVDLPHLVHA
jgi:hypothetical protein